MKKSKLNISLMTEGLKGKRKKSGCKIMKRWFSYIFIVAVCCMTFLSCSEKISEDASMFKQSQIFKLKVFIPNETRSSDTRGDNLHNNLDDSTKQQRYIEDIKVLQFDNGKLFYVVDPLTIEGSNGDSERWLKGELAIPNGKTKLVVLANIEQQGIRTDNFLNLYKNKTETEIYKKLIYSYPKENWDIEKRKLPMWGDTQEFDFKDNPIMSCNLYTGVAKMGVLVAERCTNFQMKEVYVYYINEKGYCVAPTMRPIKDIHTQYQQPEIPDCEQRKTPLKYDVKNNRILNQIYVPEADNTPEGKGEKALKIVVGGIYTGEGGDPDKLQYYLIDIADDKDNPGGEKKPYNIIRNHSYIFNIIKVTQPGASTPDDALPNLTVKIEDWAEEFMRGVPDQYTLRTDKSVIKYDNSKDLTPKILKIWTDLGEGWKIEPDPNADWYSISQYEGSANEQATIYIEPKSENHYLTRESSFYVTAGSIRKEIKVVMPQPETANSYIVGEGEHQLIVTIKGNGKEGVRPEGVNIIPLPDGSSVEDFITLHPAKLGIIWETTKGLVELWDADKNQYAKNVSNGKMTYVRLPEGECGIKYKVAITESGAQIGGKMGGNALIGAFDENNVILWSWHIWVCPELLDPITQKVKEEYIEHWTLNDYDVMDRNIGALSNKPDEVNGNSVASMGLLYQWGRKEPFVGAAHSNDNFTDDGVLPSFVYYPEPWGVLNNGEYSLTGAPTTMNKHAIISCIQHPTQLIYGMDAYHDPTGLSSIPEIGGYLWGTNNGLSTTVKDLGSKTIYDPSPVGFRVPPVDAFVFTYPDKSVYAMQEIESRYLNAGETYTLPDNSIFYYEFTYSDYLYNGTTNSFTNPYNKRIYITIYKANPYSSEFCNWNENLIYIPHYVNDRVTWYPPENYNSKNGIRWAYSGPYIVNDNYYGFYLNYAEIKEPEVNKSSPHSAGGYNVYSKLKNYENITWLPLTGAYDPTVGVKFKDGHGKTVPIPKFEYNEGGSGDPMPGFSSITVNSFLWTNSSVHKNDVRTNQLRWLPAAMFLHGTENNKAGGNPSSGRHIHNLTDVGIQADPHYAGAVRCVRNRQKTKWDENNLTAETKISNVASATTIITIVSVNADWELVKPGAPWLKVTPDHGKADKGLGSQITLTMLDPPGKKGQKTSLEFKIANEKENRKVVVEVVE